MDDFNTIKQFLMDDQGYSDREAEVAAQGLLESQPVIREAYATWRETGVLPEFNIAGMTGQMLMERYGLKPVAALLTLDWLLVDPEAARRAIAQGMDRVK